MARENRRKREERRFGKAERLADKLFDLPFGFPWYFRSSKVAETSLDTWKRHVEATADEIRRSTIIRADGVFDYFANIYGSEGFDWLGDLPTVMPPFPSLFIEMSRRGLSIPNFPEELPTPNLWGWFINLTNPDGTRAEGSTSNTTCTPLKELPGRCRYLVTATLVEESENNVKHFIDMARGMISVAIDERGTVLEQPVITMMFSEIMPEESKQAEFASMVHLAAPAFLAIGFMNCKNISVIQHNPNPTVNRERRRCGLKPFLRHHTINIEPMKAVLRTEGGIEANGLKKALHICRGHFATYTDSFFGRNLDEPLTVWRPSHVRGSAKQGVVISDYNVKAPEGAS